MDFKAPTLGWILWPGFYAGVEKDEAMQLYRFPGDLRTEEAGQDGGDDTLPPSGPLPPSLGLALPFSPSLSPPSPRPVEFEASALLTTSGKLGGRRSPWPEPRGEFPHPHRARAQARHRLLCPSSRPVCLPCLAAFLGLQPGARLAVPKRVAEPPSGASSGAGSCPQTPR